MKHLILHTKWHTAFGMGMVRATSPSVYRHHDMTFAWKDVVCEATEELLENALVWGIMVLYVRTIGVSDNII